MSALDERLLCGNPDHRRKVPAVAEVSFPSGRWHAALVCRTDLRVHLWLAESDGVAILVTPIGAVLSSEWSEQA